MLGINSAAGYSIPLSQLRRQIQMHRHAVYAFLGGMVCILLGLSLYFLPELTALALGIAGIGLPIIFLVWIRPEFGLLGVVFLASSESSYVTGTTIDVSGGRYLR